MENITPEANPISGAEPSVESVAEQLPAVGQGESQDVPTAEQPLDANAEGATEEGQPQGELYEVEFTDETGAKVTKGITVDELKKGFMLERDYRHKTAQLSEQARQFDGARTQWVQQFHQEASTKLRDIESVFHHAVQDEFANVDWEQLARNTTAEEFNQHKARYERMQARAQQATQARAQFDHQMMEQRRMRFIQETPRYVPGWSPDPTNPKNIELTRTALELGLTPDDIRGLDEPRFVVALNRVAELLGRSKQAPTQAAIAQKKVENAPPVLKPQSTRAQSAGHSQRQKESINRAMKSGRWQDLADALPPL